ncbi:MAG: DNA polymerase III subunit gamma/tau [Clostridia bacterium]|nr:DNA polymerase III subunit gamma/tau [Clostridia bacterium]
MSYQALYRKYRPTTFSEVVGQEHITKTLKNEIKENKTVHAYLFTGTRGTGKTSCAKILAKAVNCLNPVDGDPCGECEMCKAIANGEITDISEIDAASNNGVDDVRILREQVNFAPANAKYRVYIIDEVHMLSIPAFNALLKTIEEPPEHVIFILATTEVNKLPATILSRCQRFDFKRIDTDKLCERLEFTAESGGLTLSKDAAILIAATADGGMRDAISILDLCASNNKNIDETVVADVCSMAGNEYLLKLCDCIKQQDIESALVMIDELHNSSVDMLRLLSELTEHYRNLMILKTVKGDKKPIICSKKRLKELEEQADKYSLNEIMAILNILQNSAVNMQSANRRCEMEMTVIKLCKPNVFADMNALEKRIAALESGTLPTVKAAVSEKKVKVKDEAANEEATPVKEENTEKPAKDTLPITEGALNNWDDVLELLKTSSPLIAGVLGNSKAYISGNYLLIDTDNSQFKDLVNGDNPTYRDAIRTAAQTVLGKVYKLGPYRKPIDQKKDPLAAFEQKLKDLGGNS